MRTIFNIDRVHYQGQQSPIIMQLLHARLR